MISLQGLVTLTFQAFTSRCFAVLRSSSACYTFCCAGIQ
jgi:hypothetical protein